MIVNKSTLQKTCTNTYLCIKTSKLKNPNIFISKFEAKKKIKIVGLNLDNRLRKSDSNERSDEKESKH